MTDRVNESHPNLTPVPLFDPAAAAIFLDVDGTLLEFAPSPMAVSVPALLVHLLVRLRRATGGALALVSGREIATLDALFQLPDLPAAGLHGLQRRDATGRAYQCEGAVPSALIARLDAFALAHPGVIVEPKGVAVGIHFRAAPAHALAVGRLADALSHSLPPDLMVQRGNNVVEIRPAGATKGSVIAAFMGEAPFAARTPVFVGDDLTDEHGFAVVNARGGLSVKVGDGASQAQYRLANPGAVHQWLVAALAGNTS